MATQVAPQAHQTTLTSYTGPLPPEAVASAPAALNAVDLSRRTGEVTTASRSTSRKSTKKPGRDDVSVRFNGYAP